MKIATLSLAVLLSFGALFAQRQFGGPGPGMGEPKTDQLQTFLELSDQQVQELLNVGKALREAESPLMQQMRDKMQTLRETRDNGGDVTSLEADIASLRSQQQTLREQYVVQAKAILSTTQSEKLANLQKALELMPAAQEALGLNLLEAPEGAWGGPGGRPFRRGPAPAGAPPVR